MKPVEVWSIELDENAPSSERAAAVLSPTERRRARRMSGARRREFLVSHAAVRMILAARTGRDHASLRWRVGKAGKPGPVGADVHWNLSHAAGRALVAISASGPVGVDLVEVGELSEPTRIAERFFTPRERDMVRSARPHLRRRACAQLLSRKEACVKALGIRLFDGIGIGAADPSTPVEHEGDRLRVRDLGALPGWTAAVALTGDAPFTTVEHTWRWPDL